MTIFLYTSTHSWKHALLLSLFTQFSTFAKGHTHSLGTKTKNTPLKWIKRCRHESTLVSGVAWNLAAASLAKQATERKAHACVFQYSHTPWAITGTYVFLSQSPPTLGRGVSNFQNPQPLQLASLCLFWNRLSLFRGDGVHLNKLGSQMLAANIQHMVQSFKRDWLFTTPPESLSSSSASSQTTVSSATYCSLLALIPLSVHLPIQTIVKNRASLPHCPFKNSKQEESSLHKTYQWTTTLQIV